MADLVSNLIKKEAIRREMVPELKAQKEVPTYEDAIQRLIDEDNQQRIMIGEAEIPTEPPMLKPQGEPYRASQVDELQTASDLGQTVDYFTGAPARAALGAALEEGDDPIGAVKALIQQFGKHPSEAPTGEDLALRMGATKRALGDFVPGQTGGWLAKRPVSEIAGFGVDALVDISPLAAMTLPGGMMKHGGAKRFTKFNSDYIGTGEGAQAFGWGHYVTDSDDIATDYANSISNKMGAKYEISDGQKFTVPHPDIAIALDDVIEKGNFKEWKDEILRTARSGGRLDNNELYVLKVLEELEGGKTLKKTGTEANPLFYTTEIPKGEYLVWDKPLDESALKKLAENAPDDRTRMLADAYLSGDLKGMPQEDIFQSGQKFYRLLERQLGGKKQASDFLSETGFTGTQYPAGTLSGVTNSKAKNYVIFNDADLNVKEIKNLATGEIEKVGK